MPGPLAWAAWGCVRQWCPMAEERPGLAVSQLRTESPRWPQGAPAVAGTGKVGRRTVSTAIL
eukprot:12368556-Alexandrium_andersonii.AAC.1